MTLLVSSIFMALILASIISLAWTLSFKEYKDHEKLSPFECGFSPSVMAKTSFSMHFFVIALIFLVFDIELVLLFPYMVNLETSFNLFSLILMLGFLMTLSLGFMLEWTQKALEWST